MPQTSAQQALQQARAAQKAALAQLYNQQVEAFRAPAARAYQDIIYPWWKEFEQSEAGARMGLLVKETFMVDAKLFHPRISERVRYLREDGQEWEAYLFLEGGPRRLRLCVKQLRDGKEAQGMAHAMFLHQQMRRVRFTDDATLPADLDLHPIVLVDFAEQITANIVSAHIQQHLLSQGNR